MNRITRYCVYFVIASAMTFLIVEGQRFVMVPSVYSSIHQIGDRIGRVLPHGHNIEPTFSQAGRLSVQLVEPSAVPVVREGMHPEQSGSLLPKYANVDMRVPLTAVVVYLSVLFLVSTISMWRHSRSTFRVVPISRFVGTLMLGAGGCVILATMYSVSRVFWTGVNEAFVDRSNTQVLGSSSIRIDGNNLLAMSHVELIMILIAMVMSALPFLIWLDLKLFLPSKPDDQEAQVGIIPNLGRFISKYMGFNRFSETSLKTIASTCYLLTVLFLWTSPWSTTIVHAILS